MRVFHMSIKVTHKEHKGYAQKNDTTLFKHNN